MIDKNKCYYYREKKTVCGSEEICKGCYYNPDKTRLTKEEFDDMFCNIKCKECKYHNSTSHQLNYAGCKRLTNVDEVEFARVWFAQHTDGIICCDFEPSENNVQFILHYNNFNEYYGERRKDDGNPETYRTVSLCVNKHQLVRYEVKSSDWVNNTFKNEDGSLKWVRKCYYKIDRNSPTGYRLVNRYPNGEERPYPL